MARSGNRYSLLYSITCASKQYTYLPVCRGPPESAPVLQLQRQLPSHACCSRYNIISHGCVYVYVLRYAPYCTVICLARLVVGAWVWIYCWCCMSKQCSICPRRKWEIIHKWALSPHLSLFSFGITDMSIISGYIAFPLPSYLP
jgi:hypothetical protein